MIMSFLKIVSIEEAKELLDSHLKLEPTAETIPLRDALGRVLWQDFTSLRDVPPFDRSKMDGYALKAKDTFNSSEAAPAVLKVIGCLSAGDQTDQLLAEGEAMEISTGAPLPQGADAVVMVEHTKGLENGFIEVDQALAPGMNVDPSGSDIRKGILLIPGDSLLGPAQIGALASQGIDTVEVYSRPRVSLFSTGNEITRTGEALKGGGIYDINSHSLEGLIQMSGGLPIPHGIVSDDRESLRDVLKDALRTSDMIVSSGGTSKGRGDLLSDVINELGKPGVFVHGVSMKPGKPIVMGSLEGKLLFALPGNPVSAAISFMVFVSPILRKLSGLGPSSEDSLKARMARRVHSAKGRHEFLLVRLSRDKDGRICHPIPKGSGAISGLMEAQGFVEIDTMIDYLDEDDPVTVKTMGDSWVRSKNIIER